MIVRPSTEVIKDALQKAGVKLFMRENLMKRKEKKRKERRETKRYSDKVRPPCQCHNRSMGIHLSRQQGNPLTTQQYLSLVTSVPCLYYTFCQNRDQKIFIEFKCIVSSHENHKLTCTDQCLLCTFSIFFI